MKYLFSLILFFTAQFALACMPTPGVWNGPAGDPECLGGVRAQEQIYGNGGGYSAPRTEVIVTYYDYWGAFATSMSTAKTGFSEKKLSENEAKKEALRNCGLSDCVLQRTYSNAYLAASSGRAKQGGYALGIGVSQNINSAKKIAIKDCERFGGIDCRIFELRDSYSTD